MAANHAEHREERLQLMATNHAQHREGRLLSMAENHAERREERLQLMAGNHAEHREERLKSMITLRREKHSEEEIHDAKMQALFERNTFGQTPNIDYNFNHHENNPEISALLYYHNSGIFDINLPLTKCIVIILLKENKA